MRTYKEDTKFFPILLLLILSLTNLVFTFLMLNEYPWRLFFSLLMTLLIFFGNLNFRINSYFPLDNCDSFPQNLYQSLMIAFSLPYKLKIIHGKANKEFFILQKKPKKFILNVDLTSLAVVKDQNEVFNVLTGGNYLIHNGMSLIGLFDLALNSIRFPSNTLSSGADGFSSPSFENSLKIYCKFIYDRFDGFIELANLFEKQGHVGELNNYVYDKLGSLISEILNKSTTHLGIDKDTHGEFESFPINNKRMSQLIQESPNKADFGDPIKTFLLHAIQSGFLQILVYQVNNPPTLLKRDDK